MFRATYMVHPNRGRIVTDWINPLTWPLLERHASRQLCRVGRYLTSMSKCTLYGASNWIDWCYTIYESKYLVHTPCFMPLWTWSMVADLMMKNCAFFSSSRFRDSLLISDIAGYIPRSSSMLGCLSLLSIWFFCYTNKNGSTFYYRFGCYEYGYWYGAC